MAMFLRRLKASAVRSSSSNTAHILSKPFSAFALRGFFFDILLVMLNYEAFPCCNENKNLKTIVYRDFRRKPKGFYVSRGESKAFIKASFCPYCGVSIKKFLIMIE
jgi:hypothetical protein